MLGVLFAKYSVTSKFVGGGEIPEPACQECGLKIIHQLVFARQGPGLLFGILFFGPWDKVHHHIIEITAKPSDTSSNIQGSTES